MVEFRRWKVSPSELKLHYIEKWVAGKSVLDVGCGLGFYSKYLASKGFEVVAIDKEKQFKSAAFKFKIARATNLPFKNKSFDTALLFDVLEHVADAKRTLQEIKRVVRKRVIISVPNDDDSALTQHNLTFKHQKDTTHVGFYTVKSISSQLRKYGFRIKLIKLENAVSPFLFARLIRIKAIRALFMAATYVMKKFGLFDLPKADVYIVADVKSEA